MVNEVLAKISSGKRLDSCTDFRFLFASQWETSAKPNNIMATINRKLFALPIAANGTHTRRKTRVHP
jgi:hypothetical protein